MKKIRIGICKGRHPLPVKYYVFPQEVNPLDVVQLEAISIKSLVEIATQEGVEIKNTTVILDNQVDYHDITVAVYNATVAIYATGLTVAVLAVVKAAKQLFKEVVVMHYDRDSDSYYEQEI